MIRIGYVILKEPRCEGDQIVTILGSIPIDATKGDRKVPLSLVWAQPSATLHTCGLRNGWTGLRSNRLLTCW
jgi:hypothetical protein